MLETAAATETTPPAAPAPAKTEASKAPALELKVPEGFVVDDKMLADFKANAVELGLDTPKAQKLFDQYVGLETARAKATESAFVAQDAKWQAELKADPEIGGDKFAESVQHAKRAMGRFGGAPVAQLLTQAGLGNHPALVKFFVGVGKALAEDSIQGSAAPASGAQRQPLSSVLYPTMTQSQKKKE